jgi:glycosidase
MAMDCHEIAPAPSSSERRKALDSRKVQTLNRKAKLRAPHRRTHILLALVVLWPAWLLSGSGSAQGDTTWWTGAVCYEVFVRSFQDSDADGIGDLQGLIDRLDHLNDGQPGGDDLGVTCLWLMPAFPSPSYHGYDVTDYYAINPDYGSIANFDRLVQQANDRGIHILLDLPLNHTSSQHPWFIDAANSQSVYRDWYVWEEAEPDYAGPWGQDVWHEAPGGDGFYYGVFTPEMPDLNFENPEVSAEAERIMAFWLDRGVDGFRFDAVRHLIENGTVQEDTPQTHAWLAELRSFLDERYPEAFVIGEVFGAGSFALGPYYDPEQLNAYFQFEIAYQILSAADAGGPGGLRAIVQDAAEAEPDQPWGTFLTNHDQERVMTFLDADLDKAKLAAIALLTLPGLPFIYYGEEIGMTGGKPDPRIRTPMQWSRDPEQGFSVAEPWEPPQDNAAWLTVENQHGDPESLLSLYQRLIELHTARPSLSSGAFIPFTGTPSNLLAYARQEGSELTVVILNFGADPADLRSLEHDSAAVPAGDYAAVILLGGMTVPDLVVTEEGVVTLKSGDSLTLDGRTGYVFSLAPAGATATPAASATPGF